MSDVYSMAGKSAAEFAIVRASPNFDDYALWDLIESPQAEVLWRPLQLIASEGKLGDLPPCDLIGRICSQKLASVIRDVVSVVTWLPVNISNYTGVHNYSFMHFPEIVSITDPYKSTMAGGRILVPYIVESLIEQVSIMALEPLANSVVITSRIKNAIEEAGCEGVEFIKLPSGK